MSTSFMRSKPLPPTCIPELRRATWGRLFGFFIQGRRNEVNMSIEEAAGPVSYTHLDVYKRQRSV